MPYFVLLTWRNKVKNMMWWVEPQQNTFWCYWRRCLALYTKIVW
jgi:hypothetical protein